MQDDDILRISLVQYDIEWEDKTTNLSKINSIVARLAGHSDLVVLPEMCTTGFTMNSHRLAEPVTGETILLIKQWAVQYDIAICGSFIAEDSGKYYNRAFFITPSSAYYYDKRHLFRMGEETRFFSSGKNRLIVEHKGFNICLLICYDLRFPVWARNIDNQYDLLIYVANWPTSRIRVWNTLTEARALENMCYVCGVNRIGRDGNRLEHCGSSRLIDARGEIVTHIELNQEQVETIHLSKSDLNKFREKFPAWKDADSFDINI